MNAGKYNLKKENKSDWLLFTGNVVTYVEMAIKYRFLKSVQYPAVPHKADEAHDRSSSWPCAGCPCFLKPSATDWLLNIFERKSHFPVQVRFNVGVPSCARSTAEGGWLMHLPAQQLRGLIYCCVGCLGSSALQPFILPDADHLLRGAKTLHLSMGAWHLAESDQRLVGFDPWVLKNKGYPSSCLQSQLTQSQCPWKSHCDLWCEEFRGDIIQSAESAH